MLLRAVSQFIFIVLIFICLMGNAAFAQTTTFSYQGRLMDAGSPANGNYILQFKLFDAAGTQIGATISDVAVTVNQGVFNTSLDFGAAAFDGTNRFLEISVKKLPADSYTVLNPRQAILSSPYSIKSKTSDTAVNATQLGGVDASRFVQQDVGGNVSIGGNLTVVGAASYNIVNAQMQFNLGGQRILSSNAISDNLFIGFGAGQNTAPNFPVPAVGIANTFVGNDAGVANTTGLANAFFGFFSGNQNTTGGHNSFFGQAAGGQNLTGNFNSIFGSYAGYNNQAGSSNAIFGTSAGFNNTASENSFFGAFSGNANTTGAQNSFFGFRAGNANVTGSNNSFFGFEAGINNTASDNAFFGRNSGRANTSGGFNSFFGTLSGEQNTSGGFNSFFGYSAGGLNTNGTGNSFFGNAAGILNTNGSSNSFFGSIAGFSNTSGGENAFFGDSAGYDLSTSTGNTTGFRNTFVGRLSGRGITTGNNNTFIGYNTNGTANISFATALGAGASVNTNNTVVLGRNLDTVQIPGNLNVAGNLTGGNIVKNLNGLTGNVTLAAGSNITITPSGNTLTIASTGGGGSGILNQTTLQTGANFNIDGTGRASIFNAATQFQIGGNRVLYATSESGTANLFVGFSAGASTTGGFNAFVGTFAGKNNTTGDYNSYFGVSAGGGEGSTGSENTLIGNGAGFADSDGSRLTFIGVNTAGPFGFNLNNSTAVGANARVTQNNSLVLGSINGVNGASADTSVGIGTTAPKAKLDVTGGNILVGSPGQGIILKSPNGTTCRLLSIDNTGAMVLTPVTCP